MAGGTRKERTRLPGILARRPDGPPIVPSSGWSAWLTTSTAGIMAFLAVLALAAGLAAGTLAADWRADLAEAATVRLPAGTAEADTARVIDFLRATPGIASARLIPREEQAVLLEPWLGAGTVLEVLPLPVMIDLRLADGGPDADALAASLGLAAPGAVYDDHARLSAPLARMADGVQLLALAGAGLILAAAGGMVGLAARASLSANTDVVRIVRLIGAEDRFILAAFVGRIVRRTAIGATGGAALGLGALAAIPAAGAGTGLELPLLPGMAWLAALAAPIPVVFALIGWVVARITLGYALRESA